MMKYFILLFALFITLPLAAQSPESDPWDLFRQRDYNSALEQFEKHARMYPDVAAIHDMLGWCHWYLGELDEAEEGFRSALERDEEYKWSKMGLEAVAASREAPLASAKSLLESGRYLEARAAFQVLIDGDSLGGKSVIAEAMAGEAWCLYSLGRYSEAIRGFRKALKKKAPAADAYRGIAYCEYAQFDWKAALAAFELSFRQEPDDYSARLTAAWCEYMRQNWKKAKTDFEFASRLAEQPWGAKKGLGWTAYKMGDLDESLRFFISAVNDSPYALDDDIRAMAEQQDSWGSLFRQTGWSALRWQLAYQAKTEFETARKLDPTDSDALTGYAIAEFRLGNYLSSIDALDRHGQSPESEKARRFPVVLETGETDTIAMNMQSLRAWSYLRLGRFEEALALFSKVNQSHSGWVDVICGAAWSSWSLGNKDEAGKGFAEALQILPGYSDAISGLAAVNSWRFQDYNQVWQLLQDGDIEYATRKLDAIKTGKGQPFPADRTDLLFATRGWLLAASGDENAALEAFRDALELSPGLGLAHRGWGDVLADRSDWAAAAGRYSRALLDSQFENDANLMSDYAWALLEGGRLDASFDAFRSALIFDNTNVEAQAGLGFAHLELGEMVEGRIELERAAWLDPSIGEHRRLGVYIDTVKELWKLHVVLGWSWFQRGDYGQAEREFLLAQRRDPFSDYQRGLGLVYVRRGDLDKGKKIIDAYMSSLPKKETPWGVASTTLSELGWAFYAAGAGNDALRVFKDLAALHSGERLLYADPFDGQGWSQLRLKHDSKARAAFLSAIEIDPRYENSLKGLEALKEMQ